MRWAIPFLAAAVVGGLLSGIGTAACTNECLDITISGDCYKPDNNYWKITDSMGCLHNWRANPGGNGRIQGGLTYQRTAVKYDNANTCADWFTFYGRGPCVGTAEGTEGSLTCYQYCMTDY